MQPTKSLPVVETAADAFDKDDFDPLRYINEMFPSGVVCKLDTVLLLASPVHYHPLTQMTSCNDYCRG